MKPGGITLVVMVLVAALAFSILPSDTLADPPSAGEIQFTARGRNVDGARFSLEAKGPNCGSLVGTARANDGAGNRIRVNIDGQPLGSRCTFQAYEATVNGNVVGEFSIFMTGDGAGIPTAQFSFPGLLDFAQFFTLDDQLQMKYSR